MAQMSGADADALDRLGLQMEQAGRRLAANSKRLRRQINDSPWTGRNADRFRQEYNTLHTRSIAEAARFLDDAYETLSRNARQQREASGQKPGSGLSIWEQIKRWWPPTWLPRLPWWGGRAELLPMPFYRLPFPRLPFPWPYRPLPLPYLLPGFWRPPAVPVIPKDWITDIFIGLGIIGVATAPGKPGGSEQKPAPVAPAAPPAQPPAPTSAQQGPGQFSQKRLVEIAEAYNGQSRPTGWNQPGECIKWVQGWVVEAGGPQIPGGGHPFSSLASVGVQTDVANVRPGDVFQRALNDSYNGSPHTAIVKSYDAAAGTVTLVEGNFDYKGTVRTHTYRLADLQRPGHEIRFYRLGQS